MTAGRPIPSDIGEIVRRLAEIDLLLDTDAHDPSPGHLQLLIERDDLRAAAQTLRADADRDRPVVQLEAEREALLSVLEEERRNRTGFVSSNGGGNHGPAPGAWVELGVRAIQAGEMQRIVARIAAIDDELARRSVS